MNSSAKEFNNISSNGIKSSFNFIIVAFVLLFVSCSKQSENKPPANPPSATIEILQRVLYPNTDLSPLMDSLRPDVQTMTIKNDRDTLLVGDGGITLTILKNTFVNGNGQPPKVVNINLVEITSLPDIVSADLQTTSGNKVLQTAGMFFIDAKENNQSLKIANGKSIYVEFKSELETTGMKVFQGEFDDNGRIDWTKPRELYTQLIAVPLKSLDFSRGGLECVMPDAQLRILKDPKFENTTIATREFEARTGIFNLASCSEDADLSQALINIYIDNIFKPLYVSDSLAAAYVLRKYPEIDTLKEFSFDHSGWVTHFYKSFASFAKDRSGNVVDLRKLGINASTTTEQLTAKGYSQADAERYIALFKQRKQLMQEMNRTVSNERRTSGLASYSFTVSQLGWINVDKFFDDENAKESTFQVQVKSKDPLNFVFVSLIIPGYRIVLSSNHDQPNLYSFTKNQDGYRKLPVGHEAVIVAFSYKDDRPYFGRKTIRIPKDGVIEMNLKESGVIAIKRELGNLLAR